MRTIVLLAALLLPTGSAFAQCKDIVGTYAVTFVTQDGNCGDFPPEQFTLTVGADGEYVAYIDGVLADCPTIDVTEFSSPWCAVELNTSCREGGVTIEGRRKLLQTYAGWSGSYYVSGPCEGSYQLRAVRQ